MGEGTASYAQKVKAQNRLEGIRGSSPTMWENPKTGDPGVPLKGYYKGTIRVEFPKIGDPNTLNSRILIIMTPQEGTLNFRKLPCDHPRSQITQVHHYNEA